MSSLATWIFQLYEEGKLEVPISDIDSFARTWRAGVSERIHLYGKTPVVLDEDLYNLSGALVCFSDKARRTEIIGVAVGVLEELGARVSSEVRERARDIARIGMERLRSQLDQLLDDARNRFLIQIPSENSENGWVRQLADYLLKNPYIRVLLNNPVTCNEMVDPIDPVLGKQRLSRVAVTFELMTLSLTNLTIEQILSLINDSSFEGILHSPKLIFDSLQCLRNLLGQVLASPMEHDVLGCVVLERRGNRVGRIHRLTVRLFEPFSEMASPIIDFPQWSDASTQAAAQRAYTVARRIAESRFPGSWKSLADKVVRVFVDVREPLGGESFALPIALSILSHASFQKIRGALGEEIIVTGDLGDDDLGTILPVDGIEEKIHAAIEYCESLPVEKRKCLFVLPAANYDKLKPFVTQNAEKAGVRLVRSENILQLLHSNLLLIDLWKPYREECLQMDDVKMWLSSPYSEIKQERAARLKALLESVNKPGSRCVVLSEPGTDNIRSTAGLIISSIIDQGNKEHETASSANPIPMSIDVRTERVLQVITRQLGSQALGIGRSDMLLAMQGGHFAFVIRCMGRNDVGKFVTERDALDLLEGQYPLNRLIWVLSETEWSILKPLVEARRNSDVGKQYTVITLAESRRTPFDTDTDQIVVEAANRILACNRPLLVDVPDNQEEVSSFNVQADVHQFFSDEDTKEPGLAHYLPLQVAPYDLKDRKTDLENRTSLSTLVSNWINNKSGAPRILVLGEAGSGKSTEIFHLAFQCLYTDQIGSTPRSVLPLLITSRNANAQTNSMGSLLRSALSGRVVQLRQIYRDHRADEEIERHLLSDIQNTPGALILIDAFDEIASAVVGANSIESQTITDFLTSFSGTLKEQLRDAAVIVTIRKASPFEREDSLLLQSLLTNFSTYSVIPLNPEDGLEYLSSLGALATKVEPVLEISAPQRIESLVEKIGGRQSEILTRPIMLYMLSTLIGTDLNKELTYHGFPADAQLNSGLIYRFAIDHWLRQEFNEYGYYDARYGRKPSIEEKIRDTHGTLARNGIRREFYERVLEKVALFTLSLTIDIPLPFKKLRYPMLSFILYQLFCEVTANGKRIPTWWPRVEANYPWGFEPGGHDGFQEYGLFEEGRELDNLAAILLEGTLLRSWSSS